MSIKNSPRTQATVIPPRLEQRYVSQQVTVPPDSIPTEWFEDYETIHAGGDEFIEMGTIEVFRDVNGVEDGEVFQRDEIREIPILFNRGGELYGLEDSKLKSVPADTLDETEIQSINEPFDYDWFSENVLPMLL